MKKINNSKRLRYWDVVLYITEFDLFEILIRNTERISHYAYIVHDKDVWDEESVKELQSRPEDERPETIPVVGDFKKQHIHLIVDFFNAHTFSAVKKIFTTENDKPRVREILSRQGAFEYLVHKNNPDKFQYSYDLIKSDDIKYYEKFCKEGFSTDKDNISEQIVADILNNIPPRLLVKRYKRDFILNMQRYYDCADKIRLWDIEHPTQQSKDESLFKAVQESIPFD